MSFPQPNQIQRRNRGRPKKSKQSSIHHPSTTWVQEGGSNDAISRQQRCKRTRLSVDHLYRDAEAMNIVMNKAEEIKANLCRDHPVLVKILLPSHVKGGFSLGLLKDFCDDHMPMMDQMVELEDESGRVWLAKYLAGKQALSGGWRGFSNHHKLVEGDVAVFELVRPAKFKVYIVRITSTKELDVAITNPKPDALEPPGKLDETRSDEFSMDTEDANKQCSHETAHKDDKSESSGKKTSDEIKLPEPVPDFQQVENFEDFKIVTSNGSTINSELPEHVEFGYYTLCRSRNLKKLRGNWKKLIVRLRN